MSSTKTPPSLGNGNASVANSPNQDRLIEICRSQGMPDPSFQIVSDRRGGRTAWSCVITIQGYAPCPARFWYDGQYVNNAREDAAEKTLQMLRVLPQVPGPRPSAFRPPQPDDSPQ